MFLIESMTLTCEEPNLRSKRNINNNIMLSLNFLVMTGDDDSLHGQNKTGKKRVQFEDAYPEVTEPRLIY